MIELIISSCLILLDLIIAGYVIYFLLAIPGNKKLFRKLEKENKSRQKKLYKMVWITIFVNLIYFILN